MIFIENEIDITDNMDIIDFYKFKEIIAGKLTIPTDKILLFENCTSVSKLHIYKTPIFKNCIIAIFNNTSKDFNDSFITPIYFPNVKKIYINSEFDNSNCYYRFPKETWITTFLYYVPRNYNICTQKDFEANINFFKNKYYKGQTTVDKVKNNVFNLYIKTKYYMGFI